MVTSRPRSSGDPWNIADAPTKRPCLHISIKPQLQPRLQRPQVGPPPKRVPAPGVISWDMLLDQGTDQGTVRSSIQRDGAVLGPPTPVNRLVSERPLVEQDGIFATPAVEPKEVELAAANVLLGRESFMAVYDSTWMVMQPEAYRMQGLSLECTSALIAHCAATGSLLRRLQDTVARIGQLSPGGVLISLASAISAAIRSLTQELVALQHPTPPPLVQLLADAAPPARSIYYLARLLGCHNLDRPASLNVLPSAAGLLNSAYDEVLYVCNSPELYKMLWQLLGCAAKVWIGQLNIMVGLGNDADCYQFPPHEFINQRIPDMFARVGKGLYELDIDLVPKFMSKELASDVIDALNCCVLLSSQNWPLPWAKPLVWDDTEAGDAKRDAKRDTNIKRLLVSDNVDPFSPSVLQPKHIVPELAKWEERDAPLDPAVAIIFILAPLTDQAARLNQQAVKVLLDDSGYGLKFHLLLVVKLLLLAHGSFFANIKDPIESFCYGDTNGALIGLAAALEEACLDLGVPRHVAGCMAFKVRPGTGTDAIYLSYMPPEMLKPFFEPVLESCSRVFSWVIKQQQQIHQAISRRQFAQLIVLQQEMEQTALGITTRESQLWCEVNRENQTFGGLLTAIHKLAEF